MFIRKKKNMSGVISIQLIDTRSGKPKLFKTIGSSSDATKIDKLVKQGQAELNKHLKQSSFRFDWEEDRSFLNHLRSSLNRDYAIEK